MSQERRRPSADMILSIAATVISLCALVTTFWQTQINREWQQASVWPRLSLLDSMGTDDVAGTAEYSLTLGNLGIGPALIRKMRVRYRGQELSESRERPRLEVFFRKVADEHGAGKGTKLTTSQYEILPGLVVPADKRLQLLAIKGDISYGKALRAGLEHLQVTVEYSSVYGETWEVTYPNQTHRFLGWNEAQVH